ncbi:MAG: aromatic amino acid lyase, partial [Gammaproteobacteria bacterium]
VSYRIVPRVLGHAHRALAAAEHAADVSLPSVSDNPVYLMPDADHPLGRAVSTGGFHNAMAAPALDDLAAIWADLCLLCERQSTKLLNGRFSQLPDLLLVGREPGTGDGRGAIGYVTMAQCGYVEQAKAAAQRTFIPGGDPTGTGQDDVGTPVFLAWAKEERAGRCFDASLGALAAIASQALYATDRQAPPPLRGFLEWVRSILPPVGEDRVLGPQLGSLAQGITRQVYASEAP